MTKGIKVPPESYIGTTMRPPLDQMFDVRALAAPCYNCGTWTAHLRLVNGCCGACRPAISRRRGAHS